MNHVHDKSRQTLFTRSRLHGGSFKRVCVQLSPPLRYTRTAVSHHLHLPFFPFGMHSPTGTKRRIKGVHEIGVIERFAAVVSALDGSLEPREGDEFLAWLRSQGFDDAPPTPQPGGGPPTEEDETAAGTKVENQGSNGKSEGGAAEERAEVEAFLSAASARLNALVADKEDALFGDRGEAEAEESLQAKGERGGEGGAAAAGGDASGEPVVSPNMSDEDLYQVQERARRAVGASRLWSNRWCFCFPACL